jgi:hypothetical protein
LRPLPESGGDEDLDAGVVSTHVIRVVDELGGRVERATVVAEGAGRIASLGVTDDDGVLVIADLAGWVERVRAVRGQARSDFIALSNRDHTRFVSEEPDAGAEVRPRGSNERNEVEVVLVAVATKTADVRVIERSTGAPLEGIRVRAIELGRGFGLLASEVVRAEVPIVELGTTDADGWVTLGGLREGRSFLFAAAGRGFAVVGGAGSPNGGPGGAFVADDGAMIVLEADRVVGGVVRLVDSSSGLAPRVDWRAARSGVVEPLMEALPNARAISDWSTLQLLGFPAEALSEDQPGAYAFAFLPHAHVLEVLDVEVELDFPGYAPVVAGLQFSFAPFDTDGTTIVLTSDTEGLCELEFDWPASWVAQDLVALQGARGAALKCVLEPVGTTSGDVLERVVMPREGAASRVRGVPAGSYRMTLIPPLSRRVDWTVRDAPLPLDGLVELRQGTTSVEVLDVNLGAVEVQLSTLDGGTYADDLHVVLKRPRGDGETFDAVIARFSGPPYVVPAVAPGEYRIEIDRFVTSYDAVIPRSIGVVDVLPGNVVRIASTLQR